VGRCKCVNCGEIPPLSESGTWLGREMTDPPSIAWKAPAPDFWLASDKKEHSVIITSKTIEFLMLINNYLLVT